MAQLFEKFLVVALSSALAGYVAPTALKSLSYAKVATDLSVLERVGRSLGESIEEAAATGLDVAVQLLNPTEVQVESLGHLLNLRQANAQILLPVKAIMVQAKFTLAPRACAKVALVENGMILLKPC